jgi:osmotically-inducible protein OsmY
VKNNRASSRSGLTERARRLRERDRAVEEAIRERIEEHGAYAHYFSKVACKCSAGIVEVCGRVSADRLKQVLWSLILSVDGVAEIDDQLDIVSSTGLSSIRPR